MAEKMCLHDPKTGGHSCGSKKAKGILKKFSREDWMGGVWCCTNIKKDVTCPECIRLMQAGG